MPAQRDVLDFQQCRQFALSCAFVAAQKHHHAPLRTRQAKRPRLPVEPVAQLPRDIVQQETKAAVQILVEHSMVVHVPDITEQAYY